MTALEQEPRRVETPAEIDVVLVCPTCGVVESVGVKLTTRLVVERGTSSKLSLRARSLGLEHTCGQATLELLARDQGDT
jgi:hypothetical protein